MSIKATILRNSLGNIIVQLKGHLDYASSRPLKETLEDVLHSYSNVQVTLDMAGVSFVGSSGISHYVNTLKSLHAISEKTLKLTNVEEDFKRIFELYGLTETFVSIDSFELEEKTKDSKRNQSLDA